MTLQDFINKWTGKTVDTDGVYPNQCMDLMHQYLIDMFNITNPQVLSAPSAYLVYTNFDNMTGKEQFERIANTPDGVPQKGDILFFGTQIGQWGHVCIFVEGDTNSFKSFDANWPTGTLPHIQTHDYRGVLGWLRYKGQPQSDELQACLKAHSEAMTAIKERDEEITTLKASIADLTVTNQAISKDKEGLITRNKELIEEVATKEGLRAKWYELYQQSQTALETAKKSSASFQKLYTECKNQKDLTWGDLILKIWEKIRGVKI